MTATQTPPPVQTASTAIDPFAVVPAPAWRWLHGLNPLVKVIGPLPAIIALLFVRDLATPLVFLALAYVVLLTGARFTRVLAVALFAIVPISIGLIGVGFSLWVDQALVASTPELFTVGDWSVHTGAFAIGFATALRLGAILALALIGGVGTAGPDLVRSGVQYLRVPYRIGYTALAAYRFVPRFGHELDVIRQAHRVRGHHGGRGPVAALARGWGYVVPLLAGAIRHAERVALAMDARAFGAHRTRTERHLVPYRTRDTVFLILTVVISAAVFVASSPIGPLHA